VTIALLFVILAIACFVAALVTEYSAKAMPLGFIFLTIFLALGTVVR
jgi:hypothetical protein